LPPQRTGLLYITGSGSDNVGEYLPDGTLLRTITNPNMQTPRGVAVDDFGNLAVVCQDSDRILILDLEGQLLQTVTHPDLTNGTGISRSAQGNWYVGNYFPGKVVIFDPSWNHLGTLSQSGMSGVNCISFDSAGGFAVSSALSNKLFLYNSAHQPQGVVTHATIGSPMSIAMDSTGSHFVSNGSTGVITQFDASWGYLRDFGTGVLSSPQGIAINEADQLTITNWTGGLVHRYDNSGNLLGSFPATGLTVARNAAWQTSRTQLAREGGVAAANGRPERVLSVNGSSGDAHGRLQVQANTSLSVDLAVSSSGPASAAFVLYVWFGAMGPGNVFDLPQINGLLCAPIAPAPTDGYTLVNSIGQPGLLGHAVLPPVVAPGQVLNLPSGRAAPGFFTLQAIMQDDGALSAPNNPWSASNAIVVEVL
jgi:sugar lactone lactonase YvrE